MTNNTKTINITGSTVGNVLQGDGSEQINTSTESSDEECGKALSLLIQRFADQEESRHFNSESVTEAIEKAKKDLDNDKLNEEKQSFFSQLCEAMKTAGTISTSIIGLLEIWG